MTRPLTAVAIVAACLLCGCGSDGGSSPSFPPLDEQRPQEIGRPSFRVSNQQEGDKLCDAAQRDRPQAAGDADQVEFNVPGTGADVTCLLP